MIDRGFIGIYADGAEEIFSDFKETLEYIQGSEEGFYTIYFCRYSDFKILTEVVHVINQRGYVIFLESPKRMTLNLSKDLTPIHLDFLPEAEVFLNLMVVSKNVHFLGAYCDTHGNLFNAFSLNDKEAIGFGQYWREVLLEQIEYVAVSEMEMAQISDDYLQVRFEKFRKTVQEAIDSGEIKEGFDENPLSQHYYNAPSVNGEGV